MAGAQITVEFDDSQVRAALDALTDAGRDLRPAMMDIGEHLLNSARQRFADEEAPDGAAWAPLSEGTLKAKKRNRGKILTEEGHLRRLVAQADSNSVEIGSPFVYAGTHQFGTERGAFGVTSRGSPIPWGDIPARPFLVDAEGRLAPDDERAILDIVIDYLRDATASPTSGGSRTDPVPSP